MKNFSLHLIFSVCLIGVASAQQAPSTNHPPLSPSAPVVSKPAPVISNGNMLTPAEWQELRQARQAALKADPGLAASQAELSKKMHDFQEKLNAAILKTDPEVAPIVARLQGAGSRPNPMVPIPRSSPATAPQPTTSPPKPQ